MHVRIRELANLFPRGSTLIDVGSDHGYLGLELLKEDKAQRVINIDLSKVALERSSLAYERFGIIDRASFIVNDGFTGLTYWPKNSVAVIAGLGSIQILKILERLPEELNQLILMSHTSYYPIRQWASKNGFFIKREKYVDDNEYVYLILVLVRDKTTNKNTNKELLFGREEFWKYSQTELFKKYWIRNCKRILSIPYEFRDNLEKEILRYLRIEGVI